MLKTVFNLLLTFTVLGACALDDDQKKFFQYTEFSPEKSLFCEKNSIKPEGDDHYFLDTLYFCFERIDGNERNDRKEAWFKYLTEDENPESARKIIKKANESAANISKLSRFLSMNANMQEGPEAIADLIKKNYGENQLWMAFVSKIDAGKTPIDLATQKHHIEAFMAVETSYGFPIQSHVGFHHSYTYLDGSYDRKDGQKASSLVHVDIDIQLHGFAATKMAAYDPTKALVIGEVREFEYEKMKDTLNIIGKYSIKTPLEKVRAMTSPNAPGFKVVGDATKALKWVEKPLNSLSSFLISVNIEHLARIYRPDFVRPKYCWCSESEAVIISELVSYEQTVLKQVTLGKVGMPAMDEHESALLLHRDGYMERLRGIANQFYRIKISTRRLGFEQPKLNDFYLMAVKMVNAVDAPKDCASFVEANKVLEERCVPLGSSLWQVSLYQISGYKFIIQMMDGLYSKCQKNLQIFSKMIELAGSKISLEDVPLIRKEILFPDRSPGAFKHSSSSRRSGTVTPSANKIDSINPPTTFAAQTKPSEIKDEKIVTPKITLASHETIPESQEKGKPASVIVQEAAEKETPKEDSAEKSKTNELKDAKIGTPEISSASHETISESQKKGKPAAVIVEKAAEKETSKEDPDSGTCFTFSLTLALTWLLVLVALV